MMIIVAGFVRDGEHPFNVVLGVGLRHPIMVAGGYEGTKGLQFMFLMAPVVRWVGRRGKQARSRLVQAPKVQGGLEPHVGFRWEVAQITKVLDKGAARLVCEDVVDARRVGTFGDAVPIQKATVGVI